MAPIWQSPLWPRFQHDPARTEPALADVMHRIGMVRGLQEALSRDDVDDQLRRAHQHEVMASLALDDLPHPVSWPDVGAGDIWNGQGALTSQRLLRWHGLFCQASDSAGQWRADVLEIVGADDAVLYVAPPPDRIAGAVNRMLDGLNGSDDPLPVRAALAYLWCDTIQPFNDGSGVIARALAGHMLATDGAVPVALSPWIATDRRGHFAALQAGRQEGSGGIDATPFVLWFLHQLDLALAEAQANLGFLVMRNRFFLRFRTLPQRADAALGALFAAGPDAVAEGLTASLYADLARISIPTGSRDLTELEAAGVLRRGASGGRSTCYYLVL